MTERLGLVSAMLTLAHEVLSTKLFFLIARASSLPACVFLETYIRAVGTEPGAHAERNISRRV